MTQIPICVIRVCFCSAMEHLLWELAVYLALLAIGMMVAKKKMPDKSLEKEQ